MLANPRDIDLSGYRRLFTFGCSFTNWLWPTWADLLSREMPWAEYHNQGLRGSGNLFIASRLAECHRKHVFGHGDLVAVMWSTACREDRYVRSQGGWMGTGNIYSDSDIYPPDWVMENSDPFGYLLRDLCLMDMSRRMLDGIDATCVQMMVAGPTFMQDPDDRDVHELIGRYGDVLSGIENGFIDGYLGGDLGVTHSYEMARGGSIDDLHPGPVAHRGYLASVGFGLSPASLHDAMDAERRLRMHGTEAAISGEFGFTERLDAARPWLK